MLRRHSHQFVHELMPNHLGQVAPILQRLFSVFAQASEEQLEVINNLVPHFPHCVIPLRQKSAHLRYVLVRLKERHQVVHSLQAKARIFVLALCAKHAQVVQTGHQVRELPQSVDARRQVMLGSIEQFDVFAHLLDDVLTLPGFVFDELRSRRSYFDFFDD